MSADSEYKEQEEDEEEEVLEEVLEEESKKKEAGKKKEPEKKKERVIPIPKDSKGFFRARKDYPSLFQLTDDGDLKIPALRGQAERVIKIPYYRQATFDEKEEVREKRQLELAAVEQQINETKRQLREAMIEWRKTGLGTPVVLLQRELTKLDAQRAILRSPMRWVREFPNPTIRDIIFDNFYEVRKMGFNVSALRTRSLLFEDEIKASAEKPVEEKEEEEEEEEEEQKEILLVFGDVNNPTYGYLSPETLVSFVYNGTQYNSPLQAYEGERLKELGRDDKRKLLLKQTKAQGVRLLASQVIGQPKNSLELWTNILKTLVAQHPRFGDVRNTDDAILVYGNALDGKAGIGLSPEDPLAQERKSWKGENLLGQAWMAVRASLPKEVQLEKQKGGSYEEDGTGELRREQAKRGVLIHRYKMKKAF